MYLYIHRTLSSCAKVQEHWLLVICCLLKCLLLNHVKRCYFELQPIRQTYKINYDKKQINKHRTLKPKQTYSEEKPSATMDKKNLKRMSTQFYGCVNKLPKWQFVLNGKSFKMFFNDLFFTLMRFNSSYLWWFLLSRKGTRNCNTCYYICFKSLGVKENNVKATLPKKKIQEENGLSTKCEIASPVVRCAAVRKIVYQFRKKSMPSFVPNLFTCPE